METRQISQLKNWDKNPRGIKKDDFERLKSQIKELGIYKPFLITEDNIVLGGNMRLKACVDLGIKEAPVTVVKAPTDELKIKYALSDNDRAGYYEEDQLAELILSVPDLQLTDYKLDLGQLTTVQDLLSKFAPDNIEEDESPEVSDEPPDSKLGEVYQLGRHRLMCGDSTKIEDVEKLMDGKKADMVFTDPPYNIAYEGGSKKREMIKNDIVDDFYTFLFDVYSRMFENTKGGASFYVTHADSERVNFTKAFIDAGGYLSSIIIWVKDNATFGRQDYFWRHEPILYGWNSKGSHKWQGDNKQDTIWNIKRPSRSDEHPTMKPIELIVKALKNSSKSDDLILDLFGGSGSTLIACEQTDRTCYMMELDCRYIDVIRKRYWKLIDPENWETKWVDQK